MRTKEEITDLITEIDNCIGTVKDKEDLEYLGDVKASFRWVLKKLLAGQEVSKIEEEIRKQIDSPFAKLIDGELDEDGIKALTDFMNREFEGHFKIAIPDYGALETATCNVEDAWGWVLEDISTKQFLSDRFLKLK